MLKNFLLSKASALTLAAVLLNSLVVPAWSMEDEYFEMAKRRDTSIRNNRTSITSLPERQKPFDSLTAKQTAIKLEIDNGNVAAIKHFLVIPYDGQNTQPLTAQSGEKKTVRSINVEGDQDGSIKKTLRSIRKEDWKLLSTSLDPSIDAIGYYQQKKLDKTLSPILKKLKEEEIKVVRMVQEKPSEFEEKIEQLEALVKPLREFSQTSSFYSEEVQDVLLEYEISQEKRLHTGMRALQGRQDYTIQDVFLGALEKKDFPKANKALQMGANINFPVPVVQGRPDKTTRLSNALNTNEELEVLVFLAQHSAKVTMFDPNSPEYTIPLLTAATLSGHEPFVQYLINQGATRDDIEQAILAADEELESSYCSQEDKAKVKNVKDHLQKALSSKIIGMQQ